MPDESGEVEVCDAIDNDCDGLVDEDEVCAGEPCCVDDVCTGGCGMGVTADDGTCVPPDTHGDEVCDGVDNDCDGELDEADPGVGAACDTGDDGVCSAGARVCSGDPRR